MSKLTADSRIGPYRIVRLLGEGGMGEVYEAVNDSIERRVAIKVLHPQYARNPEVTVRFFNEARAVNRIEHPGIVQVSDYAQLPDCTAYIVMELLKGESLASRVHRGTVPFRSAIDIAWQIADALTAAHAKGIVHRDLKPQNIMLVSDPVAPGGERVKVLDFGIAKLTQEQSHDTATDALLGTPQYMSPEQCRGAGGADEKTDVYALGVILYEMLAGKRPFVADGAGALIILHVSEEPAPLGKLAPHVPEPAVALVHRLLQKNRKLRPTMQEVLTELRRLSQESAAAPAAAPQRRGLAAVLGGRRPSLNSTLGFSSGELTAGQGRCWRSWLSRVAVVTAITGSCGTGLLRLYPAKTAALPTKLHSAAGPVTAAAGQPARPRTDEMLAPRSPSGPAGAELGHTTEVPGPPLLSHRQKAPAGELTPVLPRAGSQPQELPLPADARSHLDKQKSSLSGKDKPPPPPNHPSVHHRVKPPAVSAPSTGPSPGAPHIKDTQNDSIRLLEN